jgi:insertion element IS1 protein InsB
MLRRLEERGVVAYFTDHYKAYNLEIEDELLYQSKALTHGIERNNGQQRHWFARFRRKSISVTRSMEMLNLTLKLFAAFHINKTISLSGLIS